VTSADKMLLSNEEQDSAVTMSNLSNPIDSPAQKVGRFSA